MKLWQKVLIAAAATVLLYSCAKNVSCDGWFNNGGCSSWGED